MEEIIHVSSESNQTSSLTDYTESVVKCFDSVPEVAKPLIGSAGRLFNRIEKTLYSAPAFVSAVKAAIPEEAYQVILTDEQKAKIEDKFTKNVPQWKAFDRFASSWASRIGWAVLYTLFFYFFATAWWQWLLLPVAYMMAPIHGVIINWFGHIYGYVNFKVSDTSKNLLRFDWLMPYYVFVMFQSCHTQGWVRTVGY